MKIENCLSNLSEDKIIDNLKWYGELEKAYKKLEEIRPKAENILLKKEHENLSEKEKKVVNEFLLLIWGDKKGFGNISITALKDENIMGKYFSLLYKLTKKLLDVSDENFIEKYKEISEELNKNKGDIHQIAYKALTIRAISILMDLKLSSIYTENIFYKLRKCLNINSLKSFPHDLIKLNTFLEDYVHLIEPIFEKRYGKADKNLLKHILPWIIYENCCKDNPPLTPPVLPKNRKYLFHLKLDNHIINSFYNSLKTKGFVILAGLSGTGKTKIFEEFVKCFYSTDFTPKEELIKKLEEFKNNFDLQEQKNLLKKFNEKYTKEYIKNMKLEDWHDNKRGLAYEIEFGEYEKLGSVKGEPAGKFGIYRKRSENCESNLKSSKEYCFDPSLGKTLNEAFEKLKSELLKLYEYSKDGNIQKIENDISGLSPLIRRKLAFLWNPNLIFNIFSDEHLKKIVSSFGEECTDFIDCQKKLKIVKQKYFSNIDNIIFTNFLYEDSVKNLWEKRDLLLKETIIKNNLFFPIRPDFKDTKSLLGFYNPLKNQYHSTPLLNFVLEASKNYLEKGKNADPFFVLFDEMNLARVEYYFADFLSILEAKRFEKKEEAVKNDSFSEFLETLSKDLSVLNEENYKFTSQSIKLHNESINDIPKELFLPPNLYFVGTVNIDETTHMFSPKVLDRAFTIEFDVGSFIDYLEFLRENSDNENSNIDENLKEDFINKGEFAVIDKQKIKEFLEKEENRKYLETLEKINNTLRKFNLHFGYRVFDEIIMFLYNCQNSYFKFDNLEEAFDLAIKMKVLPKFHGTRQRLWNPIIELLKTLELKEFEEQNTSSEDENRPNTNNENENSNAKKENIYSEIEEINSIPIFDGDILKISLKGKGEIKVITIYRHTVHKLLEMLYKLKSQGFASFM